uniref:Uncharacterized protein n=1 Tax=Moniliophthora roreri TaxID=221103 RepID=A0A0W0F2B9_MONRR
MVEVTETEEELDVFDFIGSRPVSDSLDLIFSYPQTIGQEDVAKEFALRYVELTLLGITEQVMLLELLKNLLDVLLIVVYILRVDENVVKVDNNTDVQQVSENGVDKVLESSRSIGAKHSFPLVTISNSYEMVCVVKVKLGVNGGFAQGIEQIGDERKPQKSTHRCRALDFFMKSTGALKGEPEEVMNPL